MLRSSPTEELRFHVARHATHEGRVHAPLAGVSFNRFDTPTSYAHGQAASMLLVVVVQGKKRTRVGRVELDYDPETYLMFTEETEFESRIVEATSRAPYLSMGVAMPPELVVKTLLAMPETGPAEAAPRPAYVAQIEQPLVEVLCRLCRTIDDPVERAVVAPLALEELVFRLLRSDAAAFIRHAARTGGDEPKIRRAMAFIREQAARRLTVEAIAREVSMSPSHFAHRFRELARVSPIRYLKHVRLTEARRLLLAEHLRAGEVAARVGYASPSQFTRDFKLMFDLPPAEYVRRQRQPPSQDRARQAQLST